MEKMTKEEKIKDYLQNEMTNDDFAQIAVEYLEDNEYYDDVWRSMDEFDEIMSGKTPSEIAMDIRCAGNDFNINDNYFKFDGYGNPYSSYDADYSDFTDDIVQWLMDGNGSVDSDLQDIIDADDDEEDQEEGENN